MKKNRILASVILALLLILIAASMVTAESIYIPFTAGGTEEEANLFPYTLDPNATEPQAHIATIAPYLDAPQCSSHNDRQWHGLWNAQLGCHYDHHHGDNPHAVDHVFGTDAFAIAGGEISYAWQTPNENTNKHQGYLWIVRRGLNCPTSNAAGCITDFRAQVHQLADGHDAPVRYHSASIEARVCEAANPSNCGIFRAGGWQDTGDLEVNGVKVIDEPGSGNRVKQHRHNSPNAVWYPSSQVEEQGQQGLYRISLTIHDQWDYTSPTDPGNYTDFVCYPRSNCRMNGTTLNPHLIVVDVPAQFENIVDPDNDNVANYTGYLNRYGTIVQGCTNVGLDCVPLYMQNVRTDIHYSIEARAGVRDHDIYFDNRPSGWQQPAP